MEGSLYDLNQLFTKELGPLPSYDPYSLFSTATSQQQQATPITHGVFHNEESVDFSELVEACEKNISPLSGSTRSSTGSFLDPEPSFTFENLLPDLNMYAGGNSVSPFIPTSSSIPPPPSHPTPNNYTQHLPVTSSLANVTLTPSNTHSIFTSQTLPPVLSPPSQHMLPSNSSPSIPVQIKSPRCTTKTSKKVYDKNSDEYKDRRERNNVAVRKSRNKSKQRALETEVRVKELEEENVALQNKIALLLKELNVLKNLFSSSDQSMTTANNGTSPVSMIKSEVNNGGLTGFSS